MTRLDYRYEECGLDNVILVDLETCEDDDGALVVTIQHVNVLHRAIMKAIATKQSAISGRELKFIRTELGLTQAEFAARINKDAQTVARWEKGKHAVDPTADTVIRVLALEHIGEGSELPSIKDLASWAVASSAEPPIRIDATDQETWPLAA